MSIAEPQMDRASARRARLRNEARARLVERSPVVDIGLFAEGTLKDRATARRWVRRRRDSGDLVAVDHHGQVLIPTFQLTDEFDLDPAVGEVTLRLTRHGMSPWAIWEWFTTGNGWLDGTIPADVIRTDPDRVRQAIAGLLQE